MAHGITEKDTAWLYRTPAWHGLGTVAQKRPKNAQQWLRDAGLDWTVSTKPIVTLDGVAAAAAGPKAGLVARAGEFVIPGFKAVVRDDTGDTLGIVTDRYQPFQNRDVAAFLEALLGSTLPETAFSLWEGKQVGLLTMIPDHVTVGGDEIRTYIYVRTRHDGSGALWIWPTNVRVLCANTDRIAIDEAGGRNSPTIHKIRHVGDDRSNQLAQARQALDLTINYRKQFKKQGDQLARRKMPEKTLARVLEELYPGGLTDRSNRSAKRSRDAITHLFLHGDTVGNAPGSRWSAFNAITEFEQHERSVRAADDRVRLERRFIRAFEDPDGVQQRAHDLIVAA